MAEATRPQAEKLAGRSTGNEGILCTGAVSFKAGLLCIIKSLLDTCTVGRRHNRCAARAETHSGGECMNVYVYSRPSTHTVQVQDKDQAKIEAQMELQIDRDGYLYAPMTLASL